MGPNRKRRFQVSVSQYLEAVPQALHNAAADQQFGFGRCVQFPAPASDSQRQLLEVLVDHEVVQDPALDLGQDVFIFGARQRPVEEALTNVEL